MKTQSEEKIFISEVNTETVRFLGRVLPCHLDGRTCFSHASSGIEFRFKGTCLALKLYTSAPEEKYENRRRISVFIDDMDEAYKTISLKDREEWYDIASGLSDTEHTVKVVRISEFSQNYCAVSAIKTDSPAVIPTDKKGLFIEFIGDSISAGHGNEGNGDIPFSNSVSNSEKTYCAYTAKALNADYNIIAKSGISLEFGYGGYKGEMPRLYLYRDYYNGSKDNNEWDWKSNQPDIIVINLGTNDYWAGLHGKDDAAERRITFTNAYVDFLKTVRSKNPKSVIIAALGPMTYELTDEIKSAVEIMNNSGDTNIYPLKLVPENASPQDSTGTEWHPSVITNLKMSRTLVKAIKEFVPSVK